jgi:hypothetical protein
MSTIYVESGEYTVAQLQRFIDLLEDEEAASMGGDRICKKCDGELVVNLGSGRLICNTCGS